MNYLPLIFDGILILIFIICIIDGRKKGFIKTVLSLVSVIVSFFVAQSFAAPVALWANESFAGETVSGYVENYIEDAFESEGGDPDSVNLPEKISVMLEEYGISVSDIADEASQGVEQLSAEIARRIIDAMLLPVLEMIAFLLIFIVCSLVLSLLSGFICKAFELPIIKQMNELLGGILGALKGVGVVAVLSVFAVAASKIAAGNEIANSLSEATLINAIGGAVIKLIQGG